MKYFYLDVSVLRRLDHEVIIETALLCADWELSSNAGSPAPVLSAHEFRKTLFSLIFSPADKLVVAGLSQLIALITYHHCRSPRL